jgi:SAM-dependent methyltransferase
VASLREWHENIVRGHKERLFSALTGTVLEIGAGYGANFGYYSPEIRWIGVEPDVNSHADLRRATEAHGFAADIRPLKAEQLTGIDDASIDAVVTTLVMCSVADPDAALREILRVLKPGGRYVFVEHVAGQSQTLGRGVQNFVQPLWSRLFDGCHPNRETWAFVEQAGFDRVEIEHFRVPFPMIAPHRAGLAIRSVE